MGNALFDPLVSYDADFEPQPYLAESLEPNDDFTVWTIRLREGVEFHDGTAVDAGAVAANLEAHRTALLTSPALSFVEDVEAVDDLTVEVTMIKPWSTFEHTLTSQVGYVMAPSMIDDPDGARNPVGSGPFVFESWVPDQRLVATANAGYWREGLPYLDRVEFRPIADIQTRSRELEAGSADVIETGDARQLIRFSEAAANGEVQMFSTGSTESSETFIGLNMAREPFNRPLARQALAYSIDRQALVDQSFEGLFPPALGPFQESSPYYADVDWPELDPDRARELVAEYEETYGEPLAYTAFVLPVPEVQRIGETLQQQAADVGIEVTLEALDQATLIARAVTGNYEATPFILFDAPLLDRDYVFIADFPPGNPLNFTANPNPAIVEALDAARASDDPEVWKEQFAKVQQEMATDLNFVFLVHNLGAVVFKTDVFGLADWTLPSGEAGARSLRAPLMEAWLSR